VPVTMLITAAMFALASLPTFLFLRERAKPLPADHIPGFGAAIERLRETLHHARQFPDMRRFMLCIVFYQAGIQAVIALAAIYAEQAMGFQTADTIKLVFLVNITAAIGAFVFGHVQDRIGHVRAIAATLVGWMVMILLAWKAEGPALFWLSANIAGLCLGASQSAGRALVGTLAPQARHAEFFGLWGLAVKLSSILGPLTYGIVTWISGGDHRLAILVTGSHFVIGLLILRGVDAERGRLAASAADLGAAVESDA
jgi:MFS transporter, UMF1 family